MKGRLVTFVNFLGKLCLYYVTLCTIIVRFLFTNHLILFQCFLIIPIAVKAALLDMLTTSRNNILCCQNTNSAIFMTCHEFGKFGLAGRKSVPMPRKLTKVTRLPLAHRAGQSGNETILWNNCVGGLYVLHV